MLSPLSSGSRSGGNDIGGTTDSGGAILYSAEIVVVVPFITSSAQKILKLLDENFWNFGHNLLIRR